MAADGRNLVRSASGFGKPPTSCLSQTVRGTAFQASLVAPLAEPVAESRRCERLTELLDHEGQVFAERRIEHPLQLLMNWNFERSARLLLPNRDRTVAQVLQ